MRNKKLRGKKRPSSRFFLLLVISGVAIALYASLSTMYWDGKSKISVVTVVKDGSIKIISMDPSSNKISQVLIPANTEVTVARGLGNWKIGSVWELGEQEGYSGRLLAETVTNHMSLPTPYWWDESLNSIVDGEIVSSIKAVAYGDSSLGLGDRIKILLFVTGVNNLDRSEVDLTDTYYLDKRELLDGSEGYVISGTIPKSLLLTFSRDDFSKNAATAEIIDVSGKYQLSDDFGKVVSIAGVKVTSVAKKEREKDFDCEVRGEDGNGVEYLSLLFDCKQVIEKTEGSFDFSIKIGENFAERF